MAVSIEEGLIDQEAMMNLFRTHREAEARRDYDAVIDTFTLDCYLETVALGLRSEGREAARAAYVGYFTAFPDLAPEDQGFAVGDDVLVSWGVLRGTSRGEWLGVAPSGGSFAVQFTNVSTFTDGHMHGETIYAAGQRMSGTFNTPPTPTLIMEAWHDDKLRGAGPAPRAVRPTP